MISARRAALPAAALALTALPFLLATAFIGDDHVFLAFARHAPSPLIPFVADQHGGEYYRPLPMLLWWLLGRLGAGAAWPFAGLALCLHIVISVGVGALLVMTMPRETRPSRASAGSLAAALFLLSPATRDAALWFAASTDLLATAGVLGSILLLLRQRVAVSALVALAAYLSKESAFVLPVLAYACVRAGHPDKSRRAVAFSVLPHAAIAVAVFCVRLLVLGGLGGAADQRSALHLRVVQILVGLTQEVTGMELVSQPVAWVGVLALILGAVWTVRARRRSEPASTLPAFWIAVAMLPLMAAGWPVGTRYYYLPAIGLAWLGARMLARGSQAALLMVMAAVVGLGLAQTVTRRAEIVQYRDRVGAVRRAVADGVRRGHRVFYVNGGIKDIDLAVKGWRGAVPGIPDDELFDQVLVLGDVPASFAYLTPNLSRRLSSLLAQPSIPPSGAYRFGDRAIVGFGRATVSEVLESVPDVRFIRLRLARDGRVLWRDVTEDLATVDTD